MDPYLVAICLAAMIAGAGMGLFSGLVPGIHVNTLAAMLVTAYPAISASLAGQVSVEDVPLVVSCCIVAASVVHSFVDFVPSVFIGAPDGEDAVSVLPGHRLLLKGRGMEAVRAAAIGSLIGASASILTAVPLQWLLLNGLEEPLESMTVVVLAVVSFMLVANEWRNGSGAWGLAAFLVSGMLGLACMTLPIDTTGVLGEGSIMLPLLTGLFGIPVLLSTSSGTVVPPQTDRTMDPVGPLPGIKGVLMGTIAGWFPGMTATVGASVSAAVFPEKDPARFISTVASIGTVTSILSLVVLSVSGNGRSGTALAIGEIAGGGLGGFMSPWFLMLLLSAAVASALGYLATIWSGKAMSRLASRIRPGPMSRAVIVLLTAIVLLLTGPVGVLMMAASTVVGLIPGACGTSRIVLCGCLIFPVLLFKTGLA